MKPERSKQNKKMGIINNKIVLCVMLSSLVLLASLDGATAYFDMLRGIVFRPIDDRLVHKDPLLDSSQPLPQDEMPATIVSTKT